MRELHAMIERRESTKYICFNIMQMIKEWTKYTPLWNSIFIFLKKHSKTDFHVVILNTNIIISNSSKYIYKIVCTAVRNHC